MHIKMSMTARTSEYPFRERHLLPMSTPAACLTGVGRVDFDELPASFCRFAGELGKERRPGGVRNAFRKAMMVNHAARVQVFDGYHAVAIDDLPAFLMGEVLSPECNALMHARNSLTVLTTFRRAFRQFGVLALHFRQGLFVLAEKSGIVNLSSIREGSKRLESDIDSDLFRSIRQAFRFAFYREGGVPLASRGTAYRERLDLAFERTMQNNLDLSDARSVELALLIDLEPRLRVGEAVIAPLALKTWVPWLFSGFHPAEEGFHCQVKTHRDMLQDLGMHHCQRRTFSFEYREGSLLLVQGGASAFLLVGITPLLKQVIIEPTTLFQGCVELRFLFSGWVYPVLKHLTHGRIIAQNRTEVKWIGCSSILSAFKDRPIPPRHEWRGLSGPISVKGEIGMWYVL